MSSPRRFSVAALAAVFLLAFLLPARAQLTLVLYDDALQNGFQDWSWATVNKANPAPVQSGVDSISVTAAVWQALWLEHATFSTAPFTTLSFWINGGPVGGQVVTVQGVNVNEGEGGYTIGPLATNWQFVSIPLGNLGMANATNCNGFWWQLANSGSTNVFYIDTIQLSAPSSHVTVNAAQTLRQADPRWFGINTAIWDGDFDTSTTISELKEAGWDTLRFPGGSISDEYYWSTGTSDTNTWTWATSFANFASVATNIGAQAVITVNYGSSTPAYAAAWVRSSNVTNHYAFKYWEIGNENYGSWETDTNTNPHDPHTYATRAASYIQQMKAVDSTIKIGVVVETGEDSWANGYTTPATNLVTQQVHSGWTPVVMSTLRALGVQPDFAIYHWYPEYVNDNDATLLAGTGNWTGDATNLRAMITDYFGPAGTNIELLCTENNSDSGPPGKQSVSLVNALYYADSFGQLTQTEFNSFVWWDLRNGEETDGDLSSSLYGWRMYGDLGVMNGLGTSLADRYPPFFAAKLIQHFVRGGDSMLAATSDYSLLSAYGARRTNGSLTLLVLNKDPSNTVPVQIALTNFSPSALATVYSYGIPQDQAAQTGVGSCDITQTNLAVTTNFTCSLAPYSLTVLAFAPAAPSLSVVSSNAGNATVQLSGQSGAPYVLQTSTNLSVWNSISTNRLSGSSMTWTNLLLPGANSQYWRAVWLP